MAESSPGPDKTDEHVKKRPDVADKKRLRKECEEFVIKASLKKYLEKGQGYEAFLSSLRQRINSVSKRTILASRALCCLVKELFDGQADVSKVQVPNILDVTFFRQMMLGTEDCEKPYQVIEDFFKRHPDMKDDGQRFLGDRNSFCHAATKYITNLKNNFKMQFRPRLNKFLKTLEDSKALTKEKRVVVLYDIIGWKKQGDMNNVQVDALMRSVIDKQREILELKDGEEISENWLDKNHLAILKQWVFFMNSSLLEPFDLVPINKVRHHFITIDNDTFKSMLKEANYVKSTQNLDVQTLWHTILKLENVMARESKFKFTGTIDTDGTSICMHFMRPKSKPKTKEEIEKEMKRLKALFNDPKYRKLSCDPGRANIYTIVEELPNGKIRTCSLTRNQYYNDSGVFEANKQTIAWTKPIEKELDELSKVTTKGIDLKEHVKFQETFLKLFPTLWTHYTNKKWAEQRLRLYGGKKRVMARFWNKVLGKESERVPTVIAYGSAKFAPGGKGEISVPTTSAYRVACQQKGLSVRPEDEFRSTRVHYQTERLLDKVRVEGQEKPLRGLLWCGSTNNERQGSLVSRDVNAALNILRCAKSVERPEIFDRKKAAERLPEWNEGKVLKKIVHKVWKCLKAAEKSDT